MRKLTKDDYILHGADHGFHFLDEQIPKNVTIPATWQCVTCGTVVKLSMHQIMHGHLCKECFRGKAEAQCKAIIEMLLDIKFCKIRPSWLKSPKNHAMELDMYNDDYAIAFEYQGEQHYKCLPSFCPTQDVFDYRRANDALKHTLCTKHNVLLVSIPFFPYSQNFKERVKHVQAELIKADAYTWLQQRGWAPSSKKENNIVVVINHFKKSPTALLPSTTNALMANGTWSPLTLLKVNDLVIDGNGVPTRITSISPCNNSKTVQFTFADNTTFVCGENHLVRYIERHAYDKNIIDVDEASSAFSHALYDNQHPKASFEIIKPIQYIDSHDVLPIPPYALGVLISNSAFTGTTFNIQLPDYDVFDKANALLKTFDCGFNCRQQKHRQAYIVAKHDNAVRKYLTSTFGHMHARDRFIPDEYMTAPIDARLELVQGLTDGSANVDNRGFVKFHNASVQLCKNYLTLLHSMGKRGTFYQHENTCFNSTKSYLDTRISVYGKQTDIFTSNRLTTTFAKRKVTNREFTCTVLRIKSVVFSQTVPMHSLTTESHTIVVNNHIVTSA